MRRSLFPFLPTWIILSVRDWVDKANLLIEKNKPESIRLLLGVSTCYIEENSYLCFAFSVMLKRINDKLHGNVGIGRSGWEWP